MTDVQVQYNDFDGGLGCGGAALGGCDTLADVDAALKRKGYQRHSEWTQQGDLYYSRAHELPRVEQSTCTHEHDTIRRYITTEEDEKYWVCLDCGATC